MELRNLQDCRIDVSLNFPRALLSERVRRVDVILSFNFHFVADIVSPPPVVFAGCDVQLSLSANNGE